MPRDPFQVTWHFGCGLRCVRAAAEEALHSRLSVWPRDGVALAYWRLTSRHVRRSRSVDGPASACRRRSRTVWIRGTLQNKGWKPSCAKISADVSAVVFTPRDMTWSTKRLRYVSIQTEFNLTLCGANLGIRTFILKEHVQEVMR